MERIDPYIPTPCLITGMRALSGRDVLFTIKMPSGMEAAIPGQFFMVGLPGYGEAPISVASSPLGGTGQMELCIRRVGNLTTTLHRLCVGDMLWIRGPLGRGFPVDRLKGAELIMVAGGIGIAPLRAIIGYATAAVGHSPERIVLFYGVKEPSDVLFAHEFKRWQDSGVELYLTADYAPDGWQGGVGPVTDLIESTSLGTVYSPLCCVVGPPAMYRPVVAALKRRLKLEDWQIYLSLERPMRCGVGRCGHCQINGIYLCEEGPVMSLAEAQRLPEAL